MMTVNVNMNILNKENGKLTRSKSSSKEVVVGGVPTNCRNLQFLGLQIFISYLSYFYHTPRPIHRVLKTSLSHGTWHMSDGRCKNPQKIQPWLFQRQKIQPWLFQRQKIQRWLFQRQKIQPWLFQRQTSREAKEFPQTHGTRRRRPRRTENLK